MKYERILVAGLFVVAVGTVPAWAIPTNLVADPGFESCVRRPGFPPGQIPPDWTGATAFCGPNEHSGNSDADFLATSTLSQNIVTTPGDTYDVSFWLEAAFATTANSFSVSFGGVQLFDDVGASSFDYVEEDFTVEATAASAILEFDSTEADGEWALDDVSVTDVTPSAVPEPASLALFASGLLGLGWLRRRRS